MVQSWEVALQGTVNLQDSRLVQVIFNLFSFIIVIGISFFEQTFTSPTFTLVTLGLMMPRAGIGALRSPLLLGQLLQITDADILRALPFLGFCGLVDSHQDNDDDDGGNDGGASGAGHDDNAIHTPPGQGPEGDGDT